MPLINIPTVTAPTVSDDQRASMKARQLADAPAMNYRQQFDSWSRAISMLWDDPNPALVLTKLGNKAKELFQLSTLQAQHLASVVAVGCTTEQAAARVAEIQAVLAKVPACTQHDDGTVTINA